jgi:hypothetical protein
MSLFTFKVKNVHVQPLQHCGDQSFIVAEDNHDPTARVAPHSASALHSEGGRGLAAAVDG